MKPPNFEINFFPIFAFPVLQKVTLAEIRLVPSDNLMTNVAATGFRQRLVLIL
jgi:hypothetical protein